VAVSLQVLREDHQLQELVPAKAIAAAPVKDAKLDEALAKECQATLSYAEYTLISLARTLPLVLRALMGCPFEPMDKVSLKYLIFLVALATAQRRSELHALAFTTTAFREDGG
jgi:hypothetical protein